MKKEVQDLVARHPELTNDENAINDVFKVAVEKKLNLEDAFVFANATMTDESALKKAIAKVKEIEAQKSQPEVTEPKTNRDEPEPQAKTYDELEAMLRKGNFYTLNE